MNVPFAGVVDGTAERIGAFRVINSPWHASGKECNELEREFADFIGVDHALTVNSGSSALVLALRALDLPAKAKVITSGCGFPATLNPILHLGLTPILVDYDRASQNIDLDQVEKELPKAKAMIVAHTMGNPVDMIRLMEMARKHDVKVIEDCCESVGAQLGVRETGAFGDLACFSFYPSHQINGLGMGGMVVTDNKDWALAMRSMRNWGKMVRETKFPGDHVTKYTNDIDGILYDDQYTYTTVGYNMQMPDTQAAWLRPQLKRLPGFVRKRRENWEFLNERLSAHNEVMQVLPLARPSYFGYTITHEDRSRLADHLEAHGVRQRPFFAGNITRHKPFRKYYQEFPVADHFMRNTLFVGVWPGLGRQHLEHTVKTFLSFK